MTIIINHNTEIHSAYFILFSQESKDLLSSRDKEVTKLKSEVEQYKQQAAKEVANKTKLAQLLDESTRQAIELEGTLETWQLSIREYQQRVKQLEAALMQERSHSVELEQRFSELYAKKSKEVDQLTVQVVEARKKISNKQKADKSSDFCFSNVDDSQLLFLKQAVYHMLIDSRPEEHLRAIVSILNFSAEERKAVYAKFQEKRGYTKN